MFSQNSININHLHKKNDRVPNLKSLILSPDDSNPLVLDIYKITTPLILR